MAQETLFDISWALFFICFASFSLFCPSSHCSFISCSLVILFGLVVALLLSHHFAVVPVPTPWAVACSSGSQVVAVSVIGVVFGQWHHKEGGDSEVRGRSALLWFDVTWWSWCSTFIMWCVEGGLKILKSKQLQHRWKSPFLEMKKLCKLVILKCEIYPLILTEKKTYLPVKGNLLF